MDLQKFIGYPLDVVKNELEKLGLSYKVIESSNLQKKFDTFLVVKILELPDKVIEITTDKFLLYI